MIIGIVSNKLKKGTITKETWVSWFMVEENLKC